MSSTKQEFFPDIQKIAFKPHHGASSGTSVDEDALCYRHYNPDEVLMGKSMKEWLKFSVCYWHTFRGTGMDPFGSPTLVNRPWEDKSLTPMELARRRVDAAFEFLQKLDVEYYTFHDTDVAPEGGTLEETLRNFEEIVEYLAAKQEETGIKLLWATQNLFSHPRYMHGAGTSPDLSVFCWAACQVRAVMDANHRLGGANHVFWGGREGYQSLLNTDLRQECDHMAALLRLAVDYKSRKGYTAQFLIEPKPREPCKHQYDYDAQTTIAFLHCYGLQDHFQLNIEPNHTTLAGHAAEHDIVVASAYGMLGSIDSNTGDPLLGWDTDQFPMELQQTTAIMSVVVNQGGFLSGGLNFDAKVRRESVGVRDMFVAHVGAMDCYALGLRKAIQMKEAGTLQRMLESRYISWKTDLGEKIMSGTATLEECEEYAKEQGEPQCRSGQQELFELVRNRFLYSS
jgi:xylose isomerase